LDRNFSYALKFLCHVCADGRGANDVECAADAVRNLVSGAGVQNSVAMQYVLHGHPTKEESKAKKSSVGLDLHALREYVYDDAGNPLHTGKVNVLKSTGLHLKYRCTCTTTSTTITLTSRKANKMMEKTKVGMLSILFADEVRVYAVCCICCVLYTMCSMLCAVYAMCCILLAVCCEEILFGVK
jgi:hypothetical protein